MFIRLFLKFYCVVPSNDWKSNESNWHKYIFYDALLSCSFCPNIFIIYIVINVAICIFTNLLKN